MSKKAKADSSAVNYTFVLVNPFEVVTREGSATYRSKCK